MQELLLVVGGQLTGVRVGVADVLAVLTAAGELADRVEGPRRGADGYLAKPFPFTELVARSERSAAAPGRPLPQYWNAPASGPARREASRRGRPLPVAALAAWPPATR